MDAKELWERTGVDYDAAQERYARERYPQHVYRYRRVSEMLDAALATLRADGRGALRLVDLGCGYGDLLREARAKGCEAIGVDYSLPMVELARAKLAEEGITDIDVRHGSVLELDLDDVSVDIVCAIQVFGYLPRDQEATYYGECRRVLRPGGFLITAEANNLFDIATFNKFTLAFVDEHLLAPTFDDKERATMRGRIAALLQQPDAPPRPKPVSETGNYVDALLDDPATRYSSHREQTSSKAENPLAYRDILRGFDFGVVDLAFYHFHAVPPLLFAEQPDLEALGEPLEDTLCRSWQGHLMASCFVALARLAS